MSWMQVVTALPVCLSLCALFIAIQKREAEKSFYFIFLCLFLLFYCLGYFFEVMSTTLEAAFHALVLQYFGLPFIPPAALLFVSDFLGRKPRLWARITMLLPAVATTVLVASWPVNGLYYREVAFVQDAQMAHLVLTPAPLYYVVAAYSVLLLIACIALLLGTVIKKRAQQRPACMLLLGAALPTISYGLYILHLTPGKLDYTSLVLSATLAIIGILVYRMNVLNVLPLAKSVIVDAMRDAFLIVDYECRYLRANPAAKRIFPQLVNTVPGEPLERLQKLHLQELLHSRKPSREFSTGVGPGQQHFRVSVTPLYQRSGKLACYCLMLFDITDTKRVMLELNEKATYDALTRLYNRSSFLALGEAMFQKAQDETRPFSVFAIDIDFFKRVNDRFGHPCGDKVLQEVSTHMQKRLRKTDILGRLGGEEFGVVLDCAALQDAVRIAEEIRRSIAQTVIECAQHNVQVTLSIGVAYSAAPTESDTLESMMQAADMALYRAKNGGRNRVAVAGAE